MIRITGFGPEGLRGFCIRGHAGCGRSGRDIVCAAVSAISQTAAFALPANGIRALCHQETGRGVLAVIVTEQDPERLAHAETILRSMYVGLRAVAAQHPNAVRFTPDLEVKP